MSALQILSAAAGAKLVGSRHFEVYGQVRQKSLDLLRPHACWMPDLVKSNEPTHPVDIGPLRAYAVVLQAKLVSQANQKLRFG
jgi:hypothetical protein